MKTHNDKGRTKVGDKLPFFLNGLLLMASGGQPSRAKLVFNLLSRFAGPKRSTLLLLLFFNLGLLWWCLGTGPSSVLGPHSQWCSVQGIETRLPEPCNTSTQAFVLFLWFKQPTSKWR